MVTNAVVGVVCRWLASAGLSASLGSVPTGVVSRTDCEVVLFSGGEGASVRDGKVVSFASSITGPDGRLFPKAPASKAVPTARMSAPAKDGSRVRLSAASAQNGFRDRFGAEFVVDGFGSGGRFTHWNQFAACSPFPFVTPETRLRGREKEYMRMYNAYVNRPTNAGDLSPTGPVLSDSYGILFSTTFATRPVGCVPVAMAAALQSVGFSGFTSEADYSVRKYPGRGDDWVTFCRNPKLSDGSVVLKLVPGAYDWDMLPVSFGGSQSKGSGDVYPEIEYFSGITEYQSSMWELLSRVCYNCGLMAGTEWDVSSGNTSSGNRFGLVFEGDDPVGINGIEGFADRTAEYTYFWDGYGSLFDFAIPFVRAGVPVVAALLGRRSGQIFSSYGHCVLVTGTRIIDGVTYVRMFFGHSGAYDGWYLVEYNKSVSIPAWDDIVFESIEQAMVMMPSGTAVPVEFSVDSVRGFDTSGLDVKLTGYGFDDVFHVRDDLTAAGCIRVGELNRGFGQTNVTLSAYAVRDGVGVLGTTSTVSFVIREAGPGKHVDWDSYQILSRHEPYSIVVGASEDELRNGFDASSRFTTPQEAYDMASVAGKKLCFIVGVSGERRPTDPIVASSGGLFTYLCDFDYDRGIGRDTGFSMSVVKPGLTSWELLNPWSVQNYEAYCSSTNESAVVDFCAPYR